MTGQGLDDLEPGLAAELRRWLLLQTASLADADAHYHQSKADLAAGARNKYRPAGAPEASWPSEWADAGLPWDRRDAELWHKYHGQVQAHASAARYARGRAERARETLGDG